MGILKAISLSYLCYASYMAFGPVCIIVMLHINIIGTGFKKGKGFNKGTGFNKESAREEAVPMHNE